ncbi:MAG TPA: chemotaxis protein CheW [Magnetospirillum sp.]|nr:chemotaxis protein CheW [Magnetospirillum sp.]
MIFRLSGQQFGLPVEDVREVVPYAWLSQAPKMPSFVQGVLNLGGVAVPVLRLDNLLGMPPTPIGLDASILIMKGPRSPLGLLVEHVDGVRSRHDFQYAPLEDRHSFQGCLAGQLHGPFGAIHLVSWRKVLIEEEGRRLEQFQESAQQRLMELADGGS